MTAPTMKALRTHAVGGPETLTVDDVDVPVPGKGEVLVAVKACAINYPDTLMIRDLYQFKPERPYAPGGEIAGVVEAVGEGVDGVSVGDRVMAGIGLSWGIEATSNDRRSVGPCPPVTTHRRRDRRATPRTPLAGPA